MREFEPSQPRRLAIKIFFESDYLKSAAEHFRMEQGLQRALGFAIGGSELNSRVWYSRVPRAGLEQVRPG